MALTDGGGLKGSPGGRQRRMHGGRGRQKVANEPGYLRIAGSVSWLDEQLPVPEVDGLDRGPIMSV